MSAMASQITSLTIVYSIVYSYPDQSKHQNSASLAFVWGIHRGPVNSPHKWPVTRKMFPFDYVIMVRSFMRLLWENWRRYNGIAPYFAMPVSQSIYVYAGAPPPMQYRASDPSEQTVPALWRDRVLPGCNGPVERKDGILNVNIWHIYGLTQDCSNSSALAMELLQSCAEPSIYSTWNIHSALLSFVIISLYCSS